MTDTERLDFLDAINRQTNMQSGVPLGWTINYVHGALTLSEDGPRVRPIREVLDEYHACCTSTVRLAEFTDGVDLLGFPVKLSTAAPRGCVVWCDENTREYVVRSAEGLERRVREDDIRDRALQYEEIIALAFADADISPGDK